MAEVSVAYCLRRLPRAEPTDALLLLGHAPAGLLAAYARPGGERLANVYAVADGFLVVGAVPAGVLVPGAVRLRRLAANFYLPADAELVPGLLPDEADGLTARRGLVFLPGGRVLGFAADAPVPIGALVSAGPLRRRGWRALPVPRMLAGSIEVLRMELPDLSPDELLERHRHGPGAPPAGPADPNAPGNPAAGQAPPAGQEARKRSMPGRPPRKAREVLGDLADQVGRGVRGLRRVLGREGLAALGRLLSGGAARAGDAVTAALRGRQEAALRWLLREFRRGDVDKALRRAVPLGDAGDRGLPPAPFVRLPLHRLTYSLRDLLGVPGGSFGGIGIDLWEGLRREYRRAADDAARCGDCRRAAFIYGRLLRDYEMAARTLLRGGLARDAALIYLEKLKDPAAAARAFEAAGEIDRALELYRATGQHEPAGDLLRQAGETEAALAEYQLAAQAIVAARQDYKAAGELLLGKAGRPDLAVGYFEQGWAGRRAGEAVACALRLADLYAGADTPDRMLDLVAQAEGLLAPPGAAEDAARFFNRVARLADGRGLAAVRADLRDRALLHIATWLRQWAQSGAPPGAFLSAMLGRDPAWEPPVVSDALDAMTRETRRVRRR